MKNLIKYTVFIFTILFSIKGYSQIEPEYSFLTLSSSAQMTSMGFAASSYSSNDPFASNNNPALLGYQGLSTHFSSGTSACDLMPSLGYGIKINSYTINAAYTLDKLLPVLPKISIGLGYSNYKLDYGNYLISTSHFTVVPRDGNLDNLGSEDIDSYSRFTFSMGIDYYIKISVGYAIKSVESERIMKPNFDYTLNDFGGFLEIPITSITKKIIGDRLNIYSGFEPVIDLSFGVSRSNNGSAIVQKFFPANPGVTTMTVEYLLPRLARAGMGIKLGIDGKLGEQNWMPIMFGWTVEAEDLLYDYDFNGFWYQKGIGDINFGKEIINGKTNEKTGKMKGWELNLLEIISIYGGKFSGNKSFGLNAFTTSGYSINLKGILKGLLYLDGFLKTKSELTQYIIRHLDVRFTSSKMKVDQKNNPIDNSTFYTFDLIFYN